MTMAEVKCFGFGLYSMWACLMKSAAERAAEPLCSFTACHFGSPPNRMKRPALCLAEYGLIEGAVEPTKCDIPKDGLGAPIPQTYKESGIAQLADGGKSYSAGDQMPYCNKKIQAKSHAMVCRFRQEPDCVVKVGRGSCSAAQDAACAADKAKCTCSTKKVGETAAGFGVCQVIVATRYPAATGITYSEVTKECFAEFDMGGALQNDELDSHKKFQTCLVASGGSQCPESSTADCFPWGSGGNTDAETFKQCKGFSAFADCRDTWGRDGKTSGYGWENRPYTDAETGATLFGNPTICQDDANPCVRKEADYKVFKIAVESCMPDPIQYFTTDPDYGKFYMCRSAMMSVGFSVSYEAKTKVMGFCTPSITGSGKFGHDNSCTMGGSLKIEGSLDCAMEMFNYGLYGSATVSFELEIYGGYAQGTFAASVMIAAGNKKDPFLGGAFDVELSEWSMGCCYRRQKRFKATLQFVVDVWFLPSVSYSAVMYNAKFGTPEPRGCSADVLAGCEC